MGYRGGSTWECGSRCPGHRGQPPPYCLFVCTFKVIYGEQALFIYFIFKFFLIDNREGDVTG